MKLREDGHTVITRKRGSNVLSAKETSLAVVSETHEILSCGHIDVVVHLAAINKSNGNTDNDESLHRVNTEWTLSLAKSASAANVKRFVFVSSAKVSGDGGRVVIDEGAPYSPSDDYSVSKVAAEIGLLRLSAESAMELVIFRPPAVYGPGGGENLIKLFDLINRGKSLPLGAINNRRSFIYVENFVEAVLLGVTHPSAANQTYTVSDGFPISTTDLVKMIARHLDKRIKLYDFPAPVLRVVAGLAGRGKVARSLLNSFEINDAKIRRELGWRPVYTADEGLGATAQWYRNHVCSTLDN